MSYEWTVDRSPVLRGLAPVLDAGGVEVAGLSEAQMDRVIEAHRCTVEEMGAEITALNWKLADAESLAEARAQMEEERDQERRRAYTLEKEVEKLKGLKTGVEDKRKVAS